MKFYEPIFADAVASGPGMDIDWPETTPPFFYTACHRCRNAQGLMFHVPPHQLILRRSRHGWPTIGQSGASLVILMREAAIEFLRSGLWGLTIGEPLECKSRKPEGMPDYVGCRILRSMARIDPVASGYQFMSRGEICPDCNSLPTSWGNERIIFYEGTWDGADIFDPLGRASVVSQRFVDWWTSKGYSGLSFIPAEEATSLHPDDPKRPLWPDEGQTK